MSAGSDLACVPRLVATRVLTVRTPMGRRARAKIRQGGGAILGARRDGVRVARQIAARSAALA